MPSLPSNDWLWCDGSEVTTTHAELRNSLITASYPFGQANNNPLTPDLRGRAIVGMDNLGGVSANRVTDSNADVLGGTGGAESHTLTIAQMPNHRHSLDYNSAGSNGYNAFKLVSTIEGSAAATKYTGDGQPHNNMQPWIALNFIIYGGDSV
jgi:microcystin-dependent protein